MTTTLPPRLTRDELERLRDVVPALECKGLCAKSCGRIFLFGPELALIEEALGRPVPVRPGLTQSGIPALLVEVDRKGRCPMLRSGRCTIHDERPMICRIYGTAEAAPCGFGCEPAGWLTPAEVGELLARAGAGTLGHRLPGDPD